MWDVPCSMWIKMIKMSRWYQSIYFAPFKTWCCFFFNFILRYLEGILYKNIMQFKFFSKNLTQLFLRGPFWSSNFGAHCLTIFVFNTLEIKSSHHFSFDTVLIPWVVLTLISSLIISHFLPLWTFFSCPVKVNILILIKSWNFSLVRALAFIV